MQLLNETVYTHFETLVKERSCHMTHILISMAIRVSSLTSWESLLVDEDTKGEEVKEQEITKSFPNPFFFSHFQGTKKHLIEISIIK